MTKDDSQQDDANTDTDSSDYEQYDPKNPKPRRVSEQTVPRAALLAAFCGALAFSMLLILMATRLMYPRDPLKESKEVIEEPVMPAVTSAYKTIDKDSLGYLTIDGDETIIRDAFVRLVPFKAVRGETDIWSAPVDEITRIQVALFTEELTSDIQDTLTALPDLMSSVKPKAGIPSPLFVLELQVPVDSQTCDPTFMSDGSVRFNNHHSAFSKIDVPGNIQIPISPSLLQRDGRFSASCPLLEAGQMLTMGYRYKEPLSEIPGHKLLWSIYLEKKLVPIRYLADERYMTFSESLALYHTSTQQLEIGYYPMPLSRADKQTIAKKASLTAVANKHPDAIAQIPINALKESSIIPLNRDMVKDFYTVTFYNSANITFPPNTTQLRFISRDVPETLGGEIKKGSLVSSRLEGTIQEQHPNGLYTLEFSLTTRSPVSISE